MEVVFVIPCYNAVSNLRDLVSSLTCQLDTRWRAVLVDDLSTQPVIQALKSLLENEFAEFADKFTIIENQEKKFALRNVVDVVKNRTTARIESSDIIAVVDADDSLCNSSTVGFLFDAHEQSDVVWTAHSWDINGMNISSELPEKVDPYHVPWVTSHLKSFKASLLQQISDSNFKDTSGVWFRRGYDQALYLPILKISSTRKYLPEVCYRYNINSSSIQKRDWEEKEQLKSISLIRARGFLNE